MTYQHRILLHCNNGYLTGHDDEHKQDLTLTLFKPCYQNRHNFPCKMMYVFKGKGNGGVYSHKPRYTCSNDFTHITPRSLGGTYHITFSLTALQRLLVSLLY